MGKNKTRIRIFLTTIFGKSIKHINIQENVKIVSFDVFDTLVFRPKIKNPTDVFSLIYTEDKGFKEKRISAEKTARKISAYEDIKLENIYELLNEKKYMYDIDLEINKEIDICKANKEMKELFEKIQTCKNIRIVITSDMYLSKENISQILTKCGYNISNIPIYVSSEYGLTKKSGNLFKKMMEQEQVKANEIIHIGDNYISDYFIPKKYGIKSFLYKKEKK